MTVTNVRHLWPEKKGFVLTRPSGYKKYTFLHFLNDVDILINGRIISAKKDACVIYSPDNPQWFRSRSPLLHDWIHWEDDEKICSSYLTTDSIYYPHDAAFISEQTAEIETEFYSGRQYKDEMMSVLLERLFIGLARECTAAGVPISAEQSLSARLHELRYSVMRNPCETISVADMAGRVNLSQSRFFEVYRDAFGMSPVDDMIHIKIDEAKRYLRDTDIPAGVIAQQLGYANVTHFNRQFKKFVGLTPGEYRKK